MSVFERYLTVWVALCVVAGVVLGRLALSFFQSFGRMELARVNIPVGVLVKVTVMMLVVKVVNESGPWYERGILPEPANS
jgi:arsenite transporter